MYEIYTAQYCGWCQRAKALLRQQGHEFNELDVTDDRALQEQMIERTGKKTVPQIFHGDDYIGGYEALVQSLGRS